MREKNVILCSFFFQILAIYDRFGRLIYGHPHVAKDVLEFVVFEKHIVEDTSKWRMHVKIIPEWLRTQKSQDGFLTHILDKEDVEESEKSAVEVKDTEEDDEKEDGGVINPHGKKLQRKKK